MVRQERTMAREKLTTSTAGIELVRRLAAEGDRIFSTDRARELAPSVGLSDGYLRQAIHHLVRAGWLIRIRKGLYAISSTVPGTSPVHEFEIAMALVEPAAISHWSAMHYHGLTDQAPRKVFVLTTTDTSLPRRPRGNDRGYRVGETLYQFVQTKRERYFGAQKIWIGEARVTMTDPERTLIDGLSMPQHCGDFAEVLHAFRTRGERMDVERIIGYALRLDAATAKRLGWVLEALGYSGEQLDPLLTVPIKGYRRLDPSGPRQGSCNQRWMIQENSPVKAKR
jgi:predicted transcriptional regulator of viral defense system